MLNEQLLSEGAVKKALHSAADTAFEASATLLDQLAEDYRKYAAVLPEYETVAKAHVQAAGAIRRLKFSEKVATNHHESIATKEGEAREN